MRRCSRAVHDHSLKVKIHGRKSPGLCIQCGKYVQHLYPKHDGSGNAICYFCRKGD
jgi:hypothetical protein